MNFETSITLFGYFMMTVLFLKVAKYLCYIIRVYFLTKVGFCKVLKGYGEWAVVTGATDGIGKEYAKQLAQAGLNIVLISRTRSKLEQVASEIEKAYSVETKIVVFDFTNQDGYDRIGLDLKDLDIGILINNVGMSYGSLVPFSSCDIKHTVDIINTNVVSDVRMTHLILPGMLSRKKGAIVHLSSGTIYIDVPTINVYAATKIFMQKFFRDLQMETAGIIDQQLVTPMYVESNMSRKKRQFTIPSAEEYVRSAIKTIGVTNETRGYLSHELVYFFLMNFPSFVRVVLTIMRRNRLKKE